MCVLVYARTYTQTTWVLDVSPGVGRTPGEPEESRSTKAQYTCDRVGVHSTFAYIYAGLRVLMIWANCFFSFNMSFLLRKVEDVMTISKSQSLTLVSIKDCTLRVPNETTTLFLLRVIIKAILTHSVVADKRAFTKFNCLWLFSIVAIFHFFFKFKSVH